ncbi:MAG: hypothetical protein Q8L14_12970 [Myxococcales bacterium]|nr:hypothetical protein [Myxococcales bacterium]
MPTLLLISLCVGQLTPAPPLAAPPIALAPRSSVEVEPVGRPWIRTAGAVDVVTWADRRRDAFRPNSPSSLYAARFNRGLDAFDTDAGLLVLSPTPGSDVADPMFTSSPTGAALVWTRIATDGGLTLEGKTSVMSANISLAATSISVNMSVGVRPGPTRLATSGGTFLVGWVAPNGLGLRAFTPGSSSPPTVLVATPVRDFSLGADDNGFALAWIDAATGVVQVANVSSIGVASSPLLVRAGGSWERVEVVNAQNLMVVLQNDAGTWTHSERSGPLWLGSVTTTQADPSVPVASTALGAFRFSVFQPEGQAGPSGQWQNGEQPVAWPEDASVRMLSRGSTNVVALEHPLRARIIQSATLLPPRIGLTTVPAATIAAPQRSPSIAWSASDNAFLLVWDESESATETRMTAALVGLDATLSSGPARLSSQGVAGTEPRLLVDPDGGLSVLSRIGRTSGSGVEPVQLTRPVVLVGARVPLGTPALQRARQGRVQLLQWGTTTNEVWVNGAPSGLLLAQPALRCAALLGNTFYLGAPSSQQVVNLLRVDDSTPAVVRQGAFTSLDVELQSSLCFAERPTKGDIVVAWRKGGRVMVSALDATTLLATPLYDAPHPATEEPLVTSVPDGVFLVWAERTGVMGKLIPHDGGTQIGFQLSELAAPHNVALAHSVDGDLGVAWENFDPDRDTVTVNARVLFTRRQTVPPPRFDGGDDGGVDAGLSDGGVPDGGGSDAGPDVSGVPDASVLEVDAGVPDAGTLEPVPVQPRLLFESASCGCSTPVGGASWLLGVLALLQAAHRRRSDRRITASGVGQGRSASQPRD